MAFAASTEDRSPRADPRRGAFGAPSPESRFTIPIRVGNDGRLAWLARRPSLLRDAAPESERACSRLNAVERTLAVPSGLSASRTPLLLRETSEPTEAVPRDLSDGAVIDDAERPQPRSDDDEKAESSEGASSEGASEWRVDGTSGAGGALVDSV